jgi:hypothetical protein
LISAITSRWRVEPLRVAFFAGARRAPFFAERRERVVVFVAMIPPV